MSFSCLKNIFRTVLYGNGVLSKSMNKRQENIGSSTNFEDNLMHWILFWLIDLFLLNPQGTIFPDSQSKSCQCNSNYNYRFLELNWLILASILSLVSVEFVVNSFTSLETWCLEMNLIFLSNFLIENQRLADENLFGTSFQWNYWFSHHTIYNGDC